MNTPPQYRQVPAQVDLPALEHAVLDFWREQKIFAKTLERSEGRPEWVFYEGPPTANGMPGAHHIEARVFKDVFPRFRTMRGYHVARKAGWDCHGLPVELAVEKELGFSGKPDIEAYGIAEFNAKCRESVTRHTDAFTELTTRMGYWVDMDDAYRTMDPEYIESVWWSLKQIFAKGLLVQDYRVAPWCPRCGTGLSDHELAQGYETVVDPSVYVRFPLTSGPLAGQAALLVWTTTPWTLVSNTAVAAHPEVTYVVATNGEERLVVAEPLLGDGLRPGRGGRQLRRPVHRRGPVPDVPPAQGVADAKETRPPSHGGRVFAVPRVPGTQQGGPRVENPGPALNGADDQAVLQPARRRQLSSSSIRNPRIGDGACPMGEGPCGRTGAIGCVIAGDILLLRAVRRAGGPARAAAHGLVPAVGRGARARRSHRRRRGRRQRGGRRGARRRQRVVGLRLQLPELRLQVGLQPRTVLAFEAAQVLDLALQRGAGGLQGAHRDAVLLLRVPLQGVGLGAGVPLQALGPRTRLADDLVGLGTGLRDRLVGGLLGQRQHACGAVATGTLAHRTGTPRAAHGAAHGAGAHLSLHGTGTLAHRPRTLAHRAGTLRAALSAGTGGQLRGAARQLGRASHGAAHLLLRRARYAGGHRSAGTSHALLRHPALLGHPALLRHSTLLGHPALRLVLLLLGGLAHVLLVLGGRARGGGQLGAQVLVLAQQTGQFGFDLVEEGIDLVLVIAFSEADGRELLVPHVLGGQRHLFTST
ncbi:hypothetical protein SFUMM280S_11004 [Streptomyces fumanus]